jgi:hypothetical protein
VDAKDEALVSQLADACKDHNQWLALVKFGLETLVLNQVLLFELIHREAQRRAGQTNVGRSDTDYVRMILDELRLHFVVKGESR